MVKQNSVKKRILNSKCVSQLVLPCFQAKVEAKKLFVLCCYLHKDARVVYRMKSFVSCHTPAISLRTAVSKENANRMPMKWPVGLSTRVMFSSVTPSAWKGFVQSFKVDDLLQLGVNIQTQAEKGFFSANKK